MVNPTITHQPDLTPALRVKSLHVPISHAWRMSSYSAISRTRYLPDIPEVTHTEQKANDEVKVTESEIMDVSEQQGYQEHQDLLHAQGSSEGLPIRFRFARGASPGSYLHEVLEHSDFLDPQSVHDNAMEFADKFKIDKALVPQTAEWLLETLAAPLSETADINHSFCLAEIDAQQKMAEMEFYLPLHEVDISAFNALISHWLPDFTGHYQVQHLNGMLKGYLDLVYLRKGHLYVADYKSNYLGDSLQDYGSEALHQVMLHHDYYLQALLYSLAMHRFLRNKLHNYDYQRHMGGAQYLFLRGMTSEMPGNGVLTVKPPQSLVEQLDNLFMGMDDNESQASKLSGESLSV